MGGGPPSASMLRLLLTGVAVFIQVVQLVTAWALWHAEGAGLSQRTPGKDANVPSNYKKRL